MPHSFLIKNATIINEGRIFPGSVWVEGEIIREIFAYQEKTPENLDVIDAGGCYLMPGVIDDQVHFREPGLTHKGDIFSESRAAVAGGITSFMEMPNTRPQTTTIKLLEDKFRLASERSLANYSFYLGATNDNLDQLLAADARITCGVKVFMGASTGNMLVDDEKSLENIFSRLPLLIAIHSEHEPLIRANAEQYRRQYGDNPPPEMHALIRSAEACLRSTERAIMLAGRHDTRLHILHLSTADEAEILDPAPLGLQKRITSEVCVHHLWFNHNDYARLGNLIKWNPAIKTENDRQGLLQALREGRIDIVATDHAPHTPEEKSRAYFDCPSGGPLVQHSLPLMFELVRKGEFSPSQVVDWMCHKPAVCFAIEKRGFIRKGYFADLVIADPEKPWKVDKSNILYKCRWSPLEGTELHTSVTHTFVNGRLVYHKGSVDESYRGQALTFDR